MSNKKTVAPSEEKIENSDTKGLELLSTILKENLPAVLKYLDDQRTKHTTPITKFTIGSFLVVISIILIGSGILVYVKLLDSSAFTFIIGTVMGYLFGISRIILAKKDE